jgi:HSP20 family protein
MTADGDWSPAIEAFQRGNELIVRVEVPGMKRHEITVEAADDALIIRGERRQEQTQEGDGLFWTERSYGTFSRVVPLPPWSHRGLREGDVQQRCARSGNAGAAAGSQAGQKDRHLRRAGRAQGVAS